VYFVCLEAMQNAQKYARASHVDVRLERDDGHLAFEIRDDGIGFDGSAIAGSGLQNMRDRLSALGGELEIRSSPGNGTIAMYFQKAWHWLQPRRVPDPSDAIGSLDVSVLQDRLLAPILKIADVRTDKRIDFVGGARGTGALEKLVDSGKAAVAFSLHPVSVADLMAVSDAGAIMPPKSTWFEPKLRDGLLIHVI